MRIEDRQEGSVLIVRPLEQALDAYAAPGFRERMGELIQQGNHAIVLDLGDVNFLDSTGLGAIVSSLKRLDGRGVMVICGVHDMVMEVFRLTRMDRVFPIAGTVDEALTVAHGRLRGAA